tara:strand:+ start:5500 stop:5790 length:291 start_codon:yes stop_codon:yes gene_type:complete
MIYVITYQAGRGRIVTTFNDRADLRQYANAVLIETDRWISSRDTIDDISDKLEDFGMGRGSRSHCRISRADAIEAIRDGAEPVGCDNLPRCYQGAW